MKKYPQGLFFNKPSEKAPDFVIGKLAISKKVFLDWLITQEANEKGYIYIDILNGKENKPYCALNEYKAPAKPVQEGEIDIKDVPF